MVIHGWMLKKFNLKGNELLVYACLYGFTQADNQTFDGSLNYIAEWTNATVRTIQNSLNGLIEKGLVNRTERTQNGITFYSYSVNMQMLDGDYEEISNSKISIENEIGYSVEVKDVVDYWNTTNMPHITKITSQSKRYKNLVARLREHGYTDVIKAIDNANDSDFLKGINNRGWQMDFDWFVLPNNFHKVLEGKYKNRTAVTTTYSKFSSVDSW